MSGDGRTMSEPADAHAGFRRRRAWPELAPSCSGSLLIDEPARDGH